MIKKINHTYGPVDSFIAHSFGGLAISLALEEMDHTEHHRLVLIAPATETSTAITNFCTLLELDHAVRTEFEKIIKEKGGKEADWYSVSRAIQHIRAKVLWIHDEEDAITPLADALQVKAENHPGVSFVITKGLGHSRIYRDPMVIRTVTEFL